MGARSIQYNRPPAAELIKDILIDLCLRELIIGNTHDIFVDKRFDENNTFVGEGVMFGGFQIPPIEGVEKKKEDCRENALKTDNNSADSNERDDYYSIARTDREFLLQFFFRREQFVPLVIHSSSIYQLYYKKLLLLRVV